MIMPSPYYDETPTSCTGNVTLGIFGWKKRCLYIFLLVVISMVILNLAVTLWIFKILHFSANSLGPLHIVPGGIKLSGKTVVVGALLASRIISREGLAVLLESSQNITFRTNTAQGYTTHRIHIGNKGLEFVGRTFKIRNTKGETLLSADKQVTVAGASSVRINGEGGTLFSDSMQTPLVLADPGQNLRLESLTRTVNLQAEFGIALESRAGGISVTSFKGQTLRSSSISGKIVMDLENLKLQNLRTAEFSNATILDPLIETQSVRKENYQLCNCKSGRLFFAPADGACYTFDESICE